MQHGSDNISAFNITLTTYFEQVQAAVNQLDLGCLAQVVEVLLAAHRREATIFVFGNGGSAATATHFANDLSKGCIVEGLKRFRALALTDNISLMTAWANDTSYDNIFAEQLRGLVRPGDVVIGISGSGNSPNVLKGIEVGRNAGAYTIGFCGYGGGKLRKVVDLAVSSDCMVMEQVEDVHMTVCHNLASALRTALATQELPVEIRLPATSKARKVLEVKA